MCSWTLLIITFINYMVRSNSSQKLKWIHQCEMDYSFFSIWISLFQFLLYAKESSQINSHTYYFPTRSMLLFFPRTSHNAQGTHNTTLLKINVITHFLSYLLLHYSISTLAGLCCISVFSRVKEQMKLVHYRALSIYNISITETCYTFYSFSAVFLLGCVDLCIFC